MARDYLAIQGSSVPSERAFSRSGHTDLKERNQLGDDMMEGLQLLKDGYMTGFLDANTEAARWVPKKWIAEP